MITETRTQRDRRRCDQINSQESVFLNFELLAELTLGNYVIPPQIVLGE